MSTTKSQHLYILTVICVEPHIEHPSFHTTVSCHPTRESATDEAVVFLSVFVDDNPNVDFSENNWVDTFYQCNESIELDCEPFYASIQVVNVDTCVTEDEIDITEEIETWFTENAYETDTDVDENESEDI